jgi:hypothetical protein
MYFFIEIQGRIMYGVTLFNAELLNLHLVLARKKLDTYISKPIKPLSH